MAVAPRPAMPGIGADWRTGWSASVAACQLRRRCSGLAGNALREHLGTNVGERLGELVPQALQRCHHVGAGCRTDRFPSVLRLRRRYRARSIVVV